MAFWLIVSLGSTAGLFFLLQADFVGAVQLLVYVGGTLVLLIFGVMLTAEGPYVTMKTSPAEWVVAAMVSSALMGLILVSLPLVWIGRESTLTVSGGATEMQPEGYTKAQQGRTIRPLGLALLGLRPDKDLHQPGQSSGRRLFVAV